MTHKQHIQSAYSKTLAVLETRKAELKRAEDAHRKATKELIGAYHAYYTPKTDTASTAR